MRSRTSLFLPLAALAVALSFATTMYYRQQRAVVFGEAQRILHAVGEFKVEQIVSWRAEIFAEAAYLADQPGFARVFARARTRAGDAGAELAEWLGPLRSENPDWGAPLLLDAQSRPLQVAGLGAVELLGPIGRELVATALASGRTALSDLHRATPDGADHVDLAIPIGDAAGVVLGVVLFQIDPARGLLALLQHWPTPSPTSEVLLVRAEGEHVGVLGGLRPAPGVEPVRRPLAEAGLAEAAAARGGEGPFAGVDYRGVPVVAALFPVPASPWHLVVKVDRAEIERPLHRLVLSTVAVSALLLAAAAGTLGLLWERQRRREVVQRLTAEQEAHAAAARSAALMRHANDGILLADERLRLIDVNPRLEQMSGYTRAELLAMTLRELRTEGVRGEVERTLERAQAQGSDVYETCHRRKDGSEYPVEVSGRYFEEGGRRLLLLHLRDISERRRAEAQIRALNADLERRVAERTAELQEANLELESFTYTVSHDLRSPLRSIEGFSQVLLEQHAPALEPEAQRMLGVVNANARRMARLIDDLLAFSRIGRTELRAREVDMPALARDVFEELCPAEERARTEFSIDGLSRCRGDAALLRQVWANLLANALKFASRRERVRIAVSGESRPDGIVYHVRDNGVGFDMRYVDKLFGVFERLHDPAQFEGTGVGLAIVQRIVRRHGGRVWAEGEPEGGAVFSFLLPAEGGDGGSAAG